MNSVSWFIYLADVARNLGVVATMAAIFCVAFCFGAIIVQAASEGEMSKECPNMWKYWWRCLWWALLFGVIACLLPSKNTIYAIAASQVGERIVMSQQVQGITDDATKALHQWIKRQIDPDKPEKK